MLNLFKNKLYYIIFIIFVIVASVVLLNMYIKYLISNEIRSIYKKKIKKKNIRKTEKIMNQNIQNKLLQTNHNSSLNQHYQEDNNDIINDNDLNVDNNNDNQSYLDPLMMNNENIEYQNYNPTSTKENILMRDIIDNTTNNRFK